MVSPDQAEQAADSLLEPAKQELAARQKKLARRKAIQTSLHESLFPAAVAAGVAIFFVDDIGSPSIAFFFSAAIGAIAGSMLRKGA